MASTHDDSFREIQLSGKQLVFLFMAVVVILVGIFLMGLLVGRGVLAAAAPGAEAADRSRTPNRRRRPRQRARHLDLAGHRGRKAQLRRAPGIGRAGEGTVEEPSGVRAPAEAPPTPKSEDPAPAPARRLPQRPRHAAAAPDANPPGAGFAIQVAALREREEADAIVKRLAGKGYPAYVVTPAKGAPPVFRVRVGKFKERREADTVAARLQKEEQFKPWVVR